MADESKTYCILTIIILKIKLKMIILQEIILQ